MTEEIPITEKVTIKEEVVINKEDQTCTQVEISKNPQGKHILGIQKLHAYKIYLKHLETGRSKTQCIRITAAESGLSERSLWRIISEVTTTGMASTPTNKRRRQGIYEKLTDDQKQMVRRIVHGFILRSECPTLRKIHQAITECDELPDMSHASVHRVLKKAGFVWNQKEIDSPVVSLNTE